MEEGGLQDPGGHSLVWGFLFKVLVFGGLAYLAFAILSPIVTKRLERDRDGFFDPTSSTIRLSETGQTEASAVPFEKKKQEKVVRSYPAGFEPYGVSQEYGYSRIVVTNSLNWDMVVKVVRRSKSGDFDALVRNAYVPKLEVVTIDWVPEGNYIVHLCYGEDWDNERKIFTNGPSYLMTDPIELGEKDVMVLENGSYVQRKAGTEMEIAVDNASVANLKYKISDRFSFDRAPPAAPPM